MELLKSINAGEANLLDASARCHLRFRLGGEKFPPLIYYKIFSHGGIVDINAFAPRDYMQIKRDKGKDKIDVRYDKANDGNTQGWYERIENNGWRPINDKTLTPYDPVEIRTANKTKKLLEQLYDNPFDDAKFVDMPGDQFDNEVNNLIEWCEDLDFEKYQDNWFTLATSAKAEIPGE